VATRLILAALLRVLMSAPNRGSDDVVVAGRFGWDGEMLAGFTDQAATIAAGSYCSAIGLAGGSTLADGCTNNVRPPTASPNNPASAITHRLR